LPVLDLERNVVVIRIVYDGPPEAGKTTSLRALAGSLKQPLFCPEEEGGRTLYFDWMDYTAGRFEGRPIRCQIVSVPGQRQFHERRCRLLREADAIVFVADSARPQLDLAMSFLGDLPEAVADVPAPPIGLVLQANKRDLPDAVPLAELRARLETAGWRIGVTESIAADGSGIRETFLFAVRLALDRVREAVRTKALAQGRPDRDTGVELLDWMKAGEQAEGSGPGAALAGPAIEQVLAENAADGPVSAYAPWRTAAVVEGGAGVAAPLPPDATAPSGAIWPPVDGRLTLHEAAAGGLTTHRLRNGDWAAGLGSGWRAYTRGDAVFESMAEGRTALVMWARLHAAGAGLLSPRRCLVLANAGDGSWRLWQIVRSETSLRDELEDLNERSADDAAARLLEVGGLLLDMDAKLGRAACPVPCTLDTVGRGKFGPVYIGLMPSTPPPEPSAVHGLELVKAELERLFGTALGARRADVLAALRTARRRTFAPRAAEVCEWLSALLAAGPEAAAAR
jgi:signal recognition particle receptor subunit beta